MALAATGVAVQEADGAILYTAINQQITNASPGTFAFDLDNSGSAPYWVQSVDPKGPEMDFEIYFDGNEVLKFQGYSPAFDADVAATEFSGGWTYLNKLAANSVIGSNLNWPTNGFVKYMERNDSGNSEWSGGANAYVGLRFSYDDNVTNHYGWAHVNYDDTNNVMTLVGVAMQTTADTAILAGDTGAVPEPSRALLLALGLGGAALRRRRQNA